MNMITVTQAEPEKINPEYYRILEREFRRAALVSDNVPVKVVFGVDENKESNEEIYVIVLSESKIANLYVYQIGSDDDDFYFVDAETGNTIIFDMPNDWIDLDLGESL